MMRRLLATLIVAATFGAPLGAELKFTMTMVAKPSTVAATEPVNPMMAMIAPLLAATLLPATPIQMINTVGPLGMRTEYDQAFVMIPAGAVTIVKPDGTFIVMEPAKQTYWKTAKPSTAALGIKPVVTSKKTGERATIAGLRVEKFILDIRIKLPPGVELPGLPTEFVMTADAWVSDEHKAYAKQMSIGVGALGSLGIDGAILADGFPVRVVIRGEMFGTQELEYLVTKVGEEPAAPGLFDVPAGYKEVPPPQMGIGGIGGGR